MDLEPLIKPNLPSIYGGGKVNTSTMPPYAPHHTLPCPIYPSPCPVSPSTKVNCRLPPSSIYSLLPVTQPPSLWPPILSIPLSLALSLPCTSCWPSLQLFLSQPRPSTPSGDREPKSTPSLFPTLFGWLITNFPPPSHPLTFSLSLSFSHSLLKKGLKPSHRSSPFSLSFSSSLYIFFSYYSI